MFDELYVEQIGSTIVPPSINVLSAKMQDIDARMEAKERDEFQMSNELLCK